MATWMLIIGIIIALITLPTCGLLIIFFLFPHYLVQLSFRIRQHRAGMYIKYIGNEEFIFCYAERNAPQPNRTSLVFVHGFSSSKDQWIPCFRGLPKDLHLIALDLPGHGFSSKPGDDVEIGLEFVVGSLKKFLDLVGLSNQKIHLVGSSMGGAIVGLYAAYYPDNVEKVTMVCPAMKTPIDSSFAIQMQEAIQLGPDNISHEHCILLANDIQGLKNLFDACCYNKDVMKISEQFWQGFLNLRLTKLDFYLRLFKAIATEEHIDLLAKTAPGITIPSQLIWGRNDELIHVSGAEYLRSRLPNCRYVDIIDDCGHAIDIDRPALLNEHLLKFIQDDCSQDLNPTTVLSSSSHSTENKVLSAAASESSFKKED
ncbi:unnamed protein product [Lymnaea stagnalis]|uniref:acylglycerol lipase n=1 Tax=Lymnaea stagnalis TaxID=6523 RepID=A0AAV2ILS7_LYMST